jgi:hypothetical protein
MADLLCIEPWQPEIRPGRNIEPAGVGHRAAFVPMYPGLPEQPGGYGVMLRVPPGIGRLLACVGLRDGVATALSVHVPDEDPHAFYRRHHPTSEGAWMRELAVDEIVELGTFPVPGGVVLAGDVVELHRPLSMHRRVPFVLDAKRVCRTGKRFGFARDKALVAPVCRVSVDVELYLGTELDGDGFILNAILEAI